MGTTYAIRLLGAVLVVTILLIGLRPAYDVQAATQSINFATEVEIGAQKIQPGGSVASLTVPVGAQHAEFYVEGADVLIRWNASTPVDSATGAFKWPQGHMRKEANDARRLERLRLLCTGCTVWVNYSRRWRSGDPS